MFFQKPAKNQKTKHMKKLKKTQKINKKQKKNENEKKNGFSIARVSETSLSIGERRYFWEASLVIVLAMAVAIVIRYPNR